MNLKSILLAGREILPLIEGGKGIGVTTGLTAGAWAAEGGMGTFSGVSPDYIEDGRWRAPFFRKKSRAERQDELVHYSVKGCLDHAALAHETSRGQGLVAMNILWEQGRAQELLTRVLEKAKGTIKAISCGAGMPFKLADICAANKTFYNPIVSSARTLRLLWKRSFFRFKDWIGAVIYEDPWIAGGHNGLSNADDPARPETPLARVREIRKCMNEVGLAAVPIIIAGGIWWLSEWAAYADDPEIQPVAFQFGTRPMVTQESPLHANIKKKLMSVEKGEVKLQKFSPTGFYSSAIANDFLKGLEENLSRQAEPTEQEKINGLVAAGFTKHIKLPDGKLLFMTPAQFEATTSDMRNCSGCLSACLFSAWDQRGTLGLRPDARSFCIRRSLLAAAHDDNPESALIFSGHVAHRFKDDPFYQNGAFIPTVKELIARILTGY